MPAKCTKSNQTWEITFSLPLTKVGGKDILKAFLETMGIKLEVLIEKTYKNKEYVILYLDSYRAARNIVNRLRASRLKCIQVSLRNLTSADWLKTQQPQEPYKVASRFIVNPEGSTVSHHRFSKESILMASFLAFGTGRHETTCFMIQLIDKCRGKFNTFVDIGTGSGILGIVAFKCGARKIYALDNDRESLAAAQVNFKYNKVAPVHLIKKDIKKWTCLRRFDFVAANLFTDDLLVIRKKIFRLTRPGGYLAISGIALENYSRLHKAFQALPLRCVKIMKGRYWSALLYRREG